jgi:uncharacterized repeat protein (TIGR01451 family)
MAFIVASFGTSSAWADALGSPARISVTGGPEDTDLDAHDPSLAYNTQTGQYLAVWQARQSNDESNAVYGRFVDAAGNPVGEQFAVSDPGSGCPVLLSSSGCLGSVNNPEVTYNATANEFFVVWQQDFLEVPNLEQVAALNGGCGEFGGSEIKAQRVSASGADVGPNDQLISISSRCATHPQVRWGSQDNRYLVAWGNDDDGHVYGQLVDAAGEPLLDEEIEVSEQSFSSRPDIAYDSAKGRWLVVFDRVAMFAGSRAIVPGPETSQIVGQLVDGDGATVGANVAVSDPGAAIEAAATYNAQDHEFLVTWQLDVLLPLQEAQGVAPPTQGVVAAQRLDDEAAEIGGNDFVVSDARFASAGRPSVTWDSNGNQYGLVYEAEVDPTDSPSRNVYGQILDSGGGAIGTAGFPVAERQGDEEPRTIVYNPDRCEYLTAWEGLHASDPEFESEKTEIYGRRLAAAPCSDVSVTKTASAASVEAGATIAYTMTVANAGPQDATSAKLTDALPADTTLVSVTASQGGCSGTSTVTCELGTLAAGASATVALTLKTSKAGSVVNTATVAAAGLDRNPGNNSASASTAVTAVLAASVPPPDTARPLITVKGARAFGGACGRSTRFRMRVRLSDASPIARADVLIDGKRVRRTTRRRFTVTKRLTPGRHVVRIVVRDSAGNRATRTLRVRRCAERVVLPRFTG